MIPMYIAQLREIILVGEVGPSRQYLQGILFKTFKALNLLVLRSCHQHLLFIDHHLMTDKSHSHLDSDFNNTYHKDSIYFKHVERVFNTININ